MDVNNDLSFFSLFVTSDTCTVVDLDENQTLGVVLGLDNNGKYAVVIEILEDYLTKNTAAVRQICVGDVLLSVNEHLTLNDDISDILLFLETLKECSLHRKLKFLDPSKVAEAAHIQTRAQNKDLLGFSRDLDYILGEKVYNNANVNSTAQRDLEWVAYLKHIGGPDNLKPAGNFEPSKQLKSMVRRGIPAAFRSLIWQKVSLSSIHRLAYPMNYYEDLKTRSYDLNKKVADDIEKDVKRTFPEHEYFDQGTGGDALRFVLKAYALHNPSVGYCQSLNFISGMMLLFLQEEDAFWLLLTVVDTLLPRDCYSKSMIGTHVDQLVFSKIVETSLPKIHTALVETQMQLSLVTVPWFMCLFVNTLRPEVTLRVWDMFFCEGSKVLFRIAAALLKKNETALVAAAVRDSTELFIEMKNIGRNELDADALIAMAYKSYTPPSLKAKRRRMFTSRSTGNLPGQVVTSHINAPLRKYYGASGVPCDLIGMGVAHTGPIARPLDCSAVLSPPIGCEETHSTLPLSSSSCYPSPLDGTNEATQRDTIEVLQPCYSYDSKGSSSSDKSYLISNTASMSPSCLSLFRNKSQDPASTCSVISSEIHVPCESKKSYSADCCFNKSTASAILQLGMSSFSSSGSGEGNAVVISSDVTPCAVADLGRVINSPRVQQLQQDSAKISKSGKEWVTPLYGASSVEPAGVNQKKKTNRNGSGASLFSMLLYSRSASASSPPPDSSDQYRRFKRADIDRLREDFRPALAEKFQVLENIRAARNKQDSSLKASPKRA